MRSGFIVLAGAILGVSSTASSQAIVVGGTSQSMLRTGTELSMRTLEELTTNGKMLKVGRRFNLETTDAISVNGQIVIPAGSRAVGEVTSVRNKGMWGKSGNIEARVLYVTANGRNIRASGTLNDKGVTGTGAVVGAVVLLPIAGFFMTGTSAVVPSGTNVRAFVDEDVAVAFAEGTAPTPMPVAAPVSASVMVAPGPGSASGTPVVTPADASAGVTKVSAAPR